jgi:MoxR-like ATPase
MNPRVEPLFRSMSASLVGTENAVALLITGLLSHGHVLIQGAPGLGKTSLAKAMAQSVQCRFRRIQFTPDLLPSDILGCSVYDPAGSRFVFHKGPVFGHMILADEINRASPRVQSALLEAMSERQVSVDGATYPLEDPFFVIATENNQGSAGTFPLPDSQLDRFLLSFEIGQPARENMVRILAIHASDPGSAETAHVMTRDDLMAISAEVRRLHVGRNVMEYVASLGEAIGARPEFAAPPSPRASIGLVHAARAWAFIHGRNAVYPDDVKQLVCSVFRHRLQLKGAAARPLRRIEGILDEILDHTPVPLEIA